MGCCSLRLEHVSLNPTASEVTFDFLQRFDQILEHCQGRPNHCQEFGNFYETTKTASDMIFDRLDTSMLNSHFDFLDARAHCQVFRTL